MKKEFRKFRHHQISIKKIFIVNLWNDLFSMYLKVLLSAEKEKVINSSNIAALYLLKLNLSVLCVNLMFSSSEFVQILK